MVPGRNGPRLASAATAEAAPGGQRPRQQGAGAKMLILPNKANFWVLEVVDSLEGQDVRSQVCHFDTWLCFAKNGFVWAFGVVLGVFDGVLGSSGQGVAPQGACPARMVRTMMRGLWTRFWLSMTRRTFGARSTATSPAIRCRWWMRPMARRPSAWSPRSARIWW